MVGKIYAQILVDRVCRVTAGLIDDEQEDDEILPSVALRW